MKALRDSNIIVCSIVRDAAMGLRNNRPVIDALCKLCNDYRIIIFENDSKDDTKYILTDWHNTASTKIHIYLKDTDGKRTIPSTHETKNKDPFYSFYCHKRIDKMACLRNQYMQAIDDIKFEADYVIVVDLDVARLSLNGILTSFQSQIEWDAVTAFGYSTSPRLKRRYHDTYALCLWGDQDQPQTMDKIKTLDHHLGTLRPTDDWIRIASGFGGLAIYRFEAIKGLRYQVYENYDERVEVKCEHFSIYKQMIERGYSRFYINPAMTLLYQKLTGAIIWKGLKLAIQTKLWKLSKS